MPVDERVAALEARMSEQTQTLTFFRETFARIEQRFAAIDRRFDAVDARLGRLEDRMSTQFLWTIGIQITILVAVLGALLTRP